MRLSGIRFGRFFLRFQSTHPSRGATLMVLSASSALIFQSTHPSRGATRKDAKQLKATHISIHAPLAGCDSVGSNPAAPSKDFNPRTPRGVRHRRTRDVCTKVFISIHAPLAGCDAAVAVNLEARAEFQSTRRSRGATPSSITPLPARYFNPRTPRGVRQGG